MFCEDLSIIMETCEARPKNKTAQKYILTGEISQRGHANITQTGRVEIDIDFSK